MCGCVRNCVHYRQRAKHTWACTHKHGLALPYTGLDLMRVASLSFLLTYSRHAMMMLMVVVAIVSAVMMTATVMHATCVSMDCRHDVELMATLSLTVTVSVTVRKGGGER